MSIISILTKEFLENEYKNKSVRDIARETGYSYPHIQSRIKLFKIKRRPQYLQLKGKKFNKLTVEEFVGFHESGQALWKCKCECGKYKICKGTSLNKKKIQSCGCLRKTRSYEEIPCHVFSNIIMHAKHRKIICEVSPKETWEIFLKQNRKCAISGVELKFGNKYKGIETTASLDRIDSSRGYTLDNVQWVHKRINSMKSDDKQDDFLNWIKIIYTKNFI